MIYLVSLYDLESSAHLEGSPEAEAEMAGYIAFGELAADAIRGGAALHLTDRARTIRHDGGSVTITDGPFAETTEALGGYYLLEADTLDEVIDLVRHIPVTTSPTGRSIVRPMVMTETLRDEAEELPDLWLATIHRPEDEAEQPGSDEWDAGAAEHGAFVEAHRDHLVRIAALEPTSTSTSVQVRDGELLVSDGPFPELVEVVGGFYVIQGTAEEAEAVAREVPVGPVGGVELRPVMDLSGMMD